MARTWIGPHPHERLVLPEWLGPLSNMQLPRHVMWRGLAINTIFWGAVVVLPIGVVRKAMVTTRARAGMCRACAYDALGLDQCPECGVAVTGLLAWRAGGAVFRLARPPHHVNPSPACASP
jgi:hypothetical protein